MRTGDHLHPHADRSTWRISFASLLLDVAATADDASYCLKLRMPNRRDCRAHGAHERDTSVIVNTQSFSQKALSRLAIRTHACRCLKSPDRNRCLPIDRTTPSTNIESLCAECTPLGRNHSCHHRFHRLVVFPCFSSLAQRPVCVARIGAKCVTVCRVERTLTAASDTEIVPVETHDRIDN